MTVTNLSMLLSSRRLEAELEKEREREELRLAEREAERAAKRVKAAQESEAAKQLAMAQRGMTEEEKEVSRLVLSGARWGETAGGGERRDDREGGQ